MDEVWNILNNYGPRSNLAKYKFTQETLHPSFISKRNLRSPQQKFFETSTFYHIFTIFIRK